MKELKEGDCVKLIKAGCGADDTDGACCQRHGYIIGKKYKITKVGCGNVDLESMSINCTFNISCIKHCITTMKELLE